MFYHLLALCGLPPLSQHEHPLTSLVISVWARELINIPEDVHHAPPITTNTRTAMLEFIPKDDYQEMIKAGAVLNSNVTNRASKQVHALKVSSISFVDGITATARRPNVPRYLEIDFESTKANVRDFSVVACICSENTGNVVCSLNTCAYDILKKWVTKVMSRNYLFLWPGLAAPSIANPDRLVNLKDCSNEVVACNKRCGINIVKEFNSRINEMLPKDMQTKGHITSHSSRQGGTRAGQIYGISDTDMIATTGHKSITTLQNNYHDQDRRDTKIRNSAILNANDQPISRTVKRPFPVADSDDDEDGTPDVEELKRLFRAHKKNKENESSNRETLKPVDVSSGGGSTSAGGNVFNFHFNSNPNQH